ncbi:MAG: response regulator, partial [Bacteroidales bacterium]|nr:response regulator [Bacteroidales bacterium]
YANRKFAELSGYTISELLGQNPRVIKSGYHSEAFYRTLWNTVLTGNDWVGEFINKKKSGELYWERALISPIKDEKGKEIRIIGVKEDITDRKKLVEELIKAKERAEEADRLKTSFLSNISHEIRTPMNGIVGFAELLKRPNLSLEKQHEFIAIIEQSSKRMLSIINDIIELAKIEANMVTVTLSEVNLNEVLSELQENYKTQAEEKGLYLNCNIELSDDNAVIITDANKLKQILTHLLKNALKFTHEGGITLGYTIENNTIHLYVKDTGIGIPEEYHQLIFERFRQIQEDTARQYEGAGIGLTISKAYTDMMGGKIWVDSSGNSHGAVFHVVLPFQPLKRPKKMLEKASSYQISRPVSILIVEDDEKSAQLLGEMFASDPVTIYFARDGKQAVDLVNQHHIDLVLMDLKMPEMDGFEATRIIRSKFPDIPIIAQTAYTFSDERKKAFEAGCNDYIAKPISIAKLYEIINRHLK